MPLLKRHRILASFFAAALLFAAPAARSQTAVYVQFTGQAASFSGSGWYYGPTFGFYRDQYSAGPVHLGLDFRGSILKSGSDQVDSGLGGARLTFVPHVIPFKIYGEALGGVGFVGSGSNSTHFQYQVNGGVEYTVLPHVDWRVLEVAYNGYTGNNVGNPVGLSTGVVFRLR